MEPEIIGSQHMIKAVIRPGEQSGYVAECVELGAVTQGATLDEVAANLREVVGLALEGQDLRSLGLAPDPVILVNLQLEPAVAPA
jgi:predicted RNase H-like HicB family nuclease